MNSESEIGKGIEEHMAKGDALKNNDAESVKDLRTGAERAADMEKAQRERKAEAEISELRANWDAEEKKKAAPAEATAPTEAAGPEKAKKDIWEEENKKLAGEVTELRGQIRKMGDTVTKEQKEQKEAALKPMLAKIIEQAARENPNMATDVIQTALTLPDIKGDIFKAGIRFMADELSGQSLNQLETLLKGDQEEAKIVAAMKKPLAERITKTRKRMVQKKQLPQAPLPTEKKVVELDPKRQEKMKADRQKAVREALRPAFDEVKKLSAKKSAKKKPTWIDKLLGRDKAA